MFATVHAVSGLLIASKISNPWWIFFIGFVSHYLIDFIPHGDKILNEKFAKNDEERKRIVERWFWIMLLDIFLTILLTLVFLYQQNFINWQNVLLAVFAVLLPDFFMGIGKLINLFQRQKNNNFFIKIIIGINNFHGKIHDFIPNDLKFWRGIVLQLSLITLFLFLIFL